MWRRILALFGRGDPAEPPPSESESRPARGQGPMRTPARLDEEDQEGPPPPPVPRRIENPPLPDEVAKLLQALDRHGTFPLEVEQGDREAPERWARALFGKDTRCLLRHPSPPGPLRPGRREALLEADLWLPVSEAAPALARAVSAEVPARIIKSGVVRVDPRSSAQDHVRVVLQVQLALSAPLLALPPPPAAVRVPKGKVTGSARKQCSECGAVYQVWTSNKPYQGAERDTYQEPCKKCYGDTFEITTYGDYGVELIEEYDP